MHKQEVEDNTAGLSPNEIAKILKNLQIDSGTHKRIMTAVESSQACPKDSTLCLNASADQCHQSPQSLASERNRATGNSLLSRVVEGIRQKLHRERETAPETTAPETTPSEVQACDNCHKLFRISRPQATCLGHPGMFILFTSRPMSSDSCKKHCLITCSGACRQAGRPSECRSGSI